MLGVRCSAFIRCALRNAEQVSAHGASPPRLCRFAPLPRRQVAQGLGNEQSFLLRQGYGGQVGRAILGGQPIQDLPAGGRKLPPAATSFPAFLDVRDLGHSVRDVVFRW